jgi:hypothetical protein
LSCLGDSATASFTAAGSGAGSFDYTPYYPSYVTAKDLNKKLYDLYSAGTISESSKLGIVPMDFPGVGLIKEIIKRNEKSLGMFIAANFLLILTMLSLQ